MDTCYYEMTVPVFTRSLKSLNNVLKKGEEFAREKRISDREMLEARLAPDMLPLVKQVQIASDNAKGTSARLAGIPVPSMEDTETTFAELYARIDKTIAFLDTLRPEQFSDAGERRIELPYFKDKYFIGKEFIPAYGIPNFFFHIVVAYSILRNMGVSIGKGDYIVDLPLHDMK